MPGTGCRSKKVKWPNKKLQKKGKHDIFFSRFLCSNWRFHWIVLNHLCSLALSIHDFIPFGFYSCMIHGENGHSTYNIHTMLLQWASVIGFEPTIVAQLDIDWLIITWTVFEMVSSAFWSGIVAHFFFEFDSIE